MIRHIIAVLLIVFAIGILKDFGKLDIYDVLAFIMIMVGLKL